MHLSALEDSQAEVASLHSELSPLADRYDALLALSTTACADVQRLAGERASATAECDALRVLTAEAEDACRVLQVWVQGSGQIHLFSSKKKLNRQTLRCVLTSIASAGNHPQIKRAKLREPFSDSFQAVAATIRECQTSEAGPKDACLPADQCSRCSQVQGV